MSRNQGEGGGGRDTKRGGRYEEESSGGGERFEEGWGRDMRKKYM